MKNFFFCLLAVVTLSGVEAFAQGPNTNINVQTQAQNVIYFNNVNDDVNPLEVEAQAVPQQQQSSGNIFGSEGNSQASPTTGCKDCDAVKAALKANHSSSGPAKRLHKKWSHKFSGRMDMKMKKVFSHRRKVRTTYETCFNWH